MPDQAGEAPQLRLMDLPPELLLLILPSEYTPVGMTCRLLRTLSRQKLHTLRIKCANREPSKLVDKAARRGTRWAYAARLDRALKFAAGLPALTSLFIDDMHSVCRDRTLRRLSQLTLLTRLDMPSMRNDDFDLWISEEAEELEEYNDVEPCSFWDDPGDNALTCAVMEERIRTARAMSSAVATLTQLCALNVHGNMMDGLAPLSALSALTYLDFGDNERSPDDHVLVLKRLTRLQYLDVPGIAIDRWVGPHAAHMDFAALSSLRTLLTNESLARLGRNVLPTTLQDLRLQSAGRLEKDSLQGSLSSLTCLCHLQLDCAGVIGSEGPGATPLQALAAFPSLRSLSFKSTALAGPALDEIAAMTQLQNLELCVSAGTDIDVSRLTALTRLSMGCCTLDMESVRSIASLPALEELDIRYVEMEVKDKELLTGLTSLRELRM